MKLSIVQGKDTISMGIDCAVTKTHLYVNLIAMTNMKVDQNEHCPLMLCFHVDQCPGAPPDYMRVGDDYYKSYNRSMDAASSANLCTNDNAQLATMMGREQMSALLALTST